LIFLDKNKKPFNNNELKTFRTVVILERCDKILRNENSIISKTKPDRFLKPVRFGLKVSEVI